MANSRKTPVKLADETQFDDDIAKADELASKLNALAEKSEDSFKPKTINKKEDKWSGLEEAENDAAIAVDTDDDAWF